MRGRFCSRACVVNSVNRNITSKRTSAAESKFGDALEGAGLSPERQVRFGVWTVDFLFDEAGLVVEYDGDYWHSLPRVKRIDAKKDAYFAEAGYRLVRIRESDFKRSPEEALGRVIAALAA